MNRLNRGQKEKVGTLRTIVGCSDKIAIECLNAGGWSVEGAVEVFYASGMSASAPAASRVNTNSIQQLFNRYADPTDGVILADGVGRFCDDLGVDPADIVMLVLSWHFKAATMCEFSKEEFVSGMQRLGCDSLERLKAKLPEMRREVRDEAKFRKIYDYAYAFSCEKGQKCVQLETALGMWRLLFADRSWPLLDDWCDFIEKEHKRAVSRDTWVQLLDFSKLKPDFQDWDPSGAWPYLIDEFAERKIEERVAAR